MSQVQGALYTFIIVFILTMMQSPYPINKTDKVTILRSPCQVVAVWWWSSLELQHLSKLLQKGTRSVTNHWIIGSGWFEFFLDSNKTACQKALIEQECLSRFQTLYLILKEPFFPKVVKTSVSTDPL